ncbi:MAG: hypothetical protein AB7C98_09020 [Acidithiobacillus sp.]
MRPRNKKATGRNPVTLNINNGSNYTTSQKGRRALVHLWVACRAIDGADLTDDDVLLIIEALAEITEGVHHG